MFPTFHPISLQVLVTAVCAVLPTAALAQQTGGAEAPPQGRLEITPAQPVVTAGDSLRLRARLLDTSDKPVPEATIRFQNAGLGPGAVDSTGMIRAGAPGTVNIAVVGLVPGGKPVIQRMGIRVVPGAAARLEVTGVPARLVPGQRVRPSVRVLSAGNDERGDQVTWASSASAIVRVGTGGELEARRGGKATLTAQAGAARATIPVEVVSAAPASLSIEASSAHVRRGDVVQLSLNARDAAGRPVTGLVPVWSFAPGQGRIDADGAFVPYDAGSYVVTATLGDRAASTTVVAGDRPVRRPAEVVGKLPRKEFFTSEVWVHPNGKVAYLGTAMNGDRFYTLDITDPANPRIVDSVMTSARHINDVMTDEQGKVLVFTRENSPDRKNGIVICTLDDPLHPKVVADFTEGVTGGVHSAYVYTQPNFGTHVYLTNDATGALHIVDITDPARPKEVARWKTPRVDAGRVLHDIDVRDGLLYGSWWDDGLVVLDIGAGVKGGSPSSPQFVSQFKYPLDSLYRVVEQEGGPGFIRGTHTAWRHGKYVFIADEVFGNKDAEDLFAGRPVQAYGRLQVLDVSDLEHPKSVAWYEPEYGGVHNIWVAGDTLYVGAYNGGFHAFDVSGELRGDLKAQGREIASVMTGDPGGHLPNAPMTWGVVVKDGLAYVNDFNSGLFVVRLGPSKSPGPLTP
jgi:hypothetical protein